MTKRNVILHEDFEENDAGTLLKDIESSKADELISKGIAEEVDLSTYETYKEEFEKTYDEYKAATQAIKETENPSEKTDEMQKFLLDNVKRDYEVKLDEIQEDYTANLEAAIEEAKRNRLVTTTKVSNKDKTIAKQLSNKFILDLIASSESENSARVNEIVDKIKLLNSAQKTAIQDYATNILEHIIAEKDKRVFIDEVIKVKDTALLQYDILMQVPRKIDTTKRINDLVARIYQDE